MWRPEDARLLDAFQALMVQADQDAPTRLQFGRSRGTMNASSRTRPFLEAA